MVPEDLQNAATAWVLSLVGDFPLDHPLWAEGALSTLGCLIQWLSKCQGVDVCFLLTSACAVMLKFVTVHSLFAISSFPVDTEQRFPLSRDVPRLHVQVGLPWELGNPQFKDLLFPCPAFWLTATHQCGKLHLPSSHSLTKVWSTVGPVRGQR